ncbi:hypothetical protein MUG84_26850 [Paenibacillus sp. KQZ6P-2]|uniref:Uncharacterized protein n=1 Tax=Paenibacillus mangrovi TaxID=2931978 RepID=A0A9X1WWQ9_9BACL|nr:hypothetical protein [Paenibacillus mangrovi]MCJ8015290.1 hypothetical protein [Paenibacillus mangrovi]
MGNFMTNKKVFFYSTFLILALDFIVLFLLPTYQVLFLKETNYLPLICLNIILAIFFIKNTKNGFYIVLIILIMLLFIYYLIKSLFIQCYYPFNYKEITSPQKSKSVIIEYRSDLFNQGISHYRVYQKEYAFLIRELTKKEIIITEPYFEDLPKKDLFDFETPTWINEKTVIFDTLEGQRKFKLK